MTEVMDRLPVADPISGASYSAVELSRDNDCVWMMDQRQLPLDERYRAIRRSEDVARAISDLVVRGAPAIGIAAAYGMVLAAGSAPAGADFLRHMQVAGDELTRARPTAVNLAWAVSSMLVEAAKCANSSALDRVAKLAECARQIHRDDVQACKVMGAIGAKEVPDGATVLTHCNAGALATGGFGTALGVIRAARESGKRIRVIADETRPYLQGARLTAWELLRDGIEVEVICDNMAAHFFRAGGVDLVVVGADRIARNGDVANKIGTYGLACLAKHHDRPMYVAAPWSTIDLHCESGDQIPIEQRDGLEVEVIAGKRFVPDRVSARYPAFDVTPAALVTAIFTERGAIRPVGAEVLVRMSREV